MAVRYTAAWCHHDAPGVAGFYAPHGSLRINSNMPAVGRQAIRAVAQGFMTAFPNLQVLLDNVLPQAEGAVYHWTLAGSNTGPGGTGNPVRISGYEEWRLGDDGFIVESKGRFDEADYRHQLERGAAVQG
jgi:hypothetical protein